MWPSGLFYHMYIQWLFCHDEKCGDGVVGGVEDANVIRCGKGHKQLCEL